MSATTKTTAILFIGLGLSISACDRDDGPAENFGEQVDDAVSETRERVEDAADEAREAADEIGDALRDE